MMLQLLVKRASRFAFAALICTPAILSAQSVIDLPADARPEPLEPITVGDGTVLNLNEGAVLDTHIFADSGGVVNIAAGAELRGTLRANNANVNVNGGILRSPIFAKKGTSLRIFGGSLAGIVGVEPGGSLVIAGGSRDSSGTAVQVTGEWNVQSGASVRLVGSDFLLGSEPVDGLNQPGDTVNLSGQICSGFIGFQPTIELPCNNQQDIVATLPDGNQLTFPGIIGFAGGISPDATLELTLAFPAGFCDFDGNGSCDVADADALIRATATDDSRFDFDYDGVVGGSDLDTWLSNAGQQNLGRPYRRGDANLDGAVNSEDLNQVGLNWQSSDVGWSGGDFNADRVVNAADLNFIGSSWQSNGPNVQSVPEPRPHLLLIVLALFAVRTPVRVSN